MVRPLDHVTVIQQINFAEKIHQNQQVHPEISRLQAEAVEREKRTVLRRKPQALEKSQRSKVVSREESRQESRGGRSPKKKRENRRRIDLKA